MHLQTSPLCCTQNLRSAGLYAPVTVGLFNQPVPGHLQRPRISPASAQSARMLL